ncbi:glycine receptor subunit alpha-4 isoform X3 [Diprion similis]|uniref:glycine receptor subunit alpha-4 isoform X3 n=1 Tax=Diprion similis TaxID=362088 RepID=UPI001EF7F082|nr:glycine receptor subunit alpha-4 isoform X3 [Diprion similis]
MESGPARATLNGVCRMSASLPLVLLLVLIYAAQAQRSLEFFDLLPEDPKLYDKMRPPKKDGQATVVYFHVTVMGLDSIDENSMTYAADIFFAQTWKDNRLRLPENMTSEYRLLEVDWLKNMWRPDSFFKNAKSVTFQTMTIPNHYLWLYKDKTILYMVKYVPIDYSIIIIYSHYLFRTDLFYSLISKNPEIVASQQTPNIIIIRFRLTLKLSCAMNFLIYPHDTQECKLQMESLSHTTDEMIFQWDPDVPLVVDENIELPQLQLVKNYTADCTQVYSTGNFTCLEVVFVLKRRLGYYLFHTYVPTCLIVIMSWVSFWIKPEAAPARVTLGVTSLLTLSTQHAKSQASLPPVSYLKAVDAFMSVCTIFVFMALMEYCLVNIVLGDNDAPPAKPPPPPPPPSSASGPDATKLDKIFDIATKKSAAAPPPGPTPAQRARMRALNIDRVSRVFFPFLFAVLNVTYWIMFAKYI